MRISSRGWCIPSSETNMCKGPEVNGCVLGLARRQVHWNPIFICLNKIYICQGAAGYSLHSWARDVLL